MKPPCRDAAQVADGAVGDAAGAVSAGAEAAAGAHPSPLGRWAPDAFAKDVARQGAFAGVAARLPDAAAKFMQAATEQNSFHRKIVALGLGGITPFLARLHAKNQEPPPIPPPRTPERTSFSTAKLVAEVRGLVEQNRTISQAEVEEELKRYPRAEVRRQLVIVLRALGISKRKPGRPRTPS